MQYCEEYYTGLVQLRLVPICDRCLDLNKQTQITEFEYYNYIQFKEGITFRYCKQCYHYINLKQWKCNYCKHQGTVRSIYDMSDFVCNNCGHNNFIKWSIKW